MPTTLPRQNAVAQRRGRPGFSAFVFAFAFAPVGVVYQ
jgi:hypothetical protein